MKRGMKKRNLEDRNTDRSIGIRIKTMRQLQGLTQAQLGEIIGVDNNEIERYESAKAGVMACRLLKIANALKTTVEWLYIGDTPTRYGEKFMPSEILYDPKAMRHLATYKNLNQRQRNLIQSLANALKEASEWHSD